jgi:phosphoadenosine phosphosulfate reductase
MIEPDRPLDVSALAALNARFESAGPETILRWVDDSFGPAVALACSFGGASGLVLVEMAARLGLRAEIFYADTDLLFPETYALIDELVRRLTIAPVGYRSRLSLAEQADRHGDALWQRDPDRCCYLRKVEPTERALSGKRAWISGIRRDQAATRRATPFVEWDQAFGLVKVNPLATWTEDDAWAHLRARDIPYNPLLDRGYASIGCWPCTKPVRPGDDPRSGRWSGFDKTECGLHVREGRGSRE